MNQTDKTSIVIIGVGVVGTALKTVFVEKKLNVKTYDKFKQDEGTLEEVLTSDILFLALPTPYDDDTKEYNKNAIYEICTYLKDHTYSNTVVLKSTVEPGTTRLLQKKYGLNIVHNPQLL